MRIKSILAVTLLVAVTLCGCSQNDRLIVPDEVNTVPAETVEPTPIVEDDAVSAQGISFSAGDETGTPEPTSSAEPSATAAPTQTPDVSATPKKADTPKATATPKPDPAPKAAVKPEPTATPTPTPVPVETEKPAETPKPEDDMTVEGSAYGQKVLAGVNEVREMNGATPLSYGGSGSLMDRCKEMAKGGTLLAPKGSNESTSKSNNGGKTMGIFSAVHAWGIGNGEYTTLYVASVVYNGTRWTIVRAE